MREQPHPLSTGVDFPSVVHCVVCGDDACSECEEQQTPCQTCEGTYCSDCITVETCSTCHETHCESCSDMNFCLMCEETFCEGCRTVMYCDACGEGFCENCRPVMHCEKCGTWECAECTVYHESSCCELLCCDECLQTCSHCGFRNCNDVECEARREMNWCNDCEAWHCDEC